MVVVMDKGAPFCRAAGMPKKDGSVAIFRLIHYFPVFWAFHEFGCSDRRFLYPHYPLSIQQCNTSGLPTPFFIGKQAGSKYGADFPPYTAAWTATDENRCETAHYFENTMLPSS
jgi:hypothetical protein